MNHGLEYPAGLLDSLPTINPPAPPAPSANSTKPNRTPPPIRLLPPPLFTSLHRTHLLAHPPDHVLFPFLHGLEGDNEAQNTFFANASAGSHWAVGVEVPVIPPAGHGKMPRSVASLQAQGVISSSNSDPAATPGLGQAVVQHHQLLRPKVPRYRGLVWVVCEEDVRGKGDKVTLSVLRRKPIINEGESHGARADMGRGDSGMDIESDDEDGSWYDETSGSSWEEDEDEDESDLELGHADDERDLVVIHEDDEGTAKATKSKAELTKDEMDAMPYMHPVISPHSHHHTALTSINTSFTGASADPETATATSSSASISSTPSIDASTAPTSVSGSPVSASPDAKAYPQVIELEEVEAPSSTAQLKTVEHHEEENGNKQKRKDKASARVAVPGDKPRTKLKTKVKTDPAAPPLLTCTFRPKELLRKRRIVNGSAAERQAEAEKARKRRKSAEPKEEEGDDARDEVVWEFVPARVPDGISLRNFGIQMPIYATISDIVVYSPSGPTKATIALAERFRQAIERKRKERVEALKGVVYSQLHHGGPGNPGLAHFIRIEDVLNAEKEKRDMVRAEKKRVKEQEKQDAKDGAGTAAPPPTAASEITTSTSTSSDGLPNHSPSSPSPSDSDSDSSYTSDIDEDDEEDLETRMFDTAERYLLSLVEDDLLDYNVFVLDGTEEDMRKLSSSTKPNEGGMAHLMIRSCGAGVPGGVDHGRVGIVTSKKGTPATGPHTIGSDGELQGEKEVEQKADLNHTMRASVERMDVDGDATSMDMDVETAGDVDMAAVDGKLSSEHSDDDEEYDYSTLIPNTVDFALREKEEMRDLTKASEIISLFPSTKYGDRSSPPGSATGTKWTSSPISVSSQVYSSQPSHLQHLSKLIPPPSPGRGASPFSPPQQQQHVEYAFTHPDTSVDISSPATFFDPLVGQVFLGNSGDVPLAANAKEGVSVTVSGKVKRRSVNDKNTRDSAPEPEDEDDEELSADDPFTFAATNDPENGFGYDICVECHEMAPFPTPAHVRAAEEHLSVLEVMWRNRCVDREKARRRRKAREDRRKEGLEDADADDEEDYDEDATPITVPPRPPPHANAVIHLPFPSSPSNTQQTMAQLMPVMRFLEKWIRPVPGEVKVEVEIKTKKKDTTPTPTSEQGMAAQQQQGSSGVRRWSSSVANLMPSVFGGGSSSSNASPPLSTNSSRSRSFTTPAPSSHTRNASTSSTSSSSGSPTPAHPTRPLKLLLYSADGYTESSLSALCLLMSIKGLTLPEAYLDLQVGKRRSFFVYGHDLGVLRRVESRLIEEREREREKAQRERERQETVERMVREARERELRERAAREERMARSDGEDSGVQLNANGKRTIGSVHRGAVKGSASEKGAGGGLSLFKVFEGAAAALPRANSTTASNNATATTSPPSSAGVGAGGKPQHAFTGRPAAKSVSFSQAPTWGQRPPQAVPASTSTQAPSSTVRVPPTIPQGIPAPPTSGHIALLPPEEYTGSLPGNASGVMNHQRKTATLPIETSQPSTSTAVQPRQTGAKRPRANTSPWLPSFFGGDHQSWFNDPRFDGSFPSRVLPFLYLGNLNHASNVYMLHALGITHVVSVGECALLPPPYHMAGHSSSGNLSNSPACAPRTPHHGGHQNSHGRSGHGSLWIEEREGRIKVLDIKGVCDDGIDTLEPQLEPICDWIDKAREEGGQVLVHCRVGVSRSATVTIAYVMKHLSLPLVDAYLIVRSRRLSVLIQPNMRLLYNLCGWEIKLAKERAGWVEESAQESESRLILPGSKTKERLKMERRLERELARTLTWPYLSMEVHKLNEKYLH